MLKSSGDTGRPVVTLYPVVIYKNFNKGALGTTTPIVWVRLNYNHAHVFKDGNKIV